MIQAAVKVLAPALSLTLASWLIYDSQEHLASVRETREASHRKLQTAQEAQQSFERIRSSQPIVSRRESNLEDSTFLNGIRKHASLKDVQILKWSSTEEDFQNEQLKGLKRVTSHLSVVGRYANLFNFVEALSASPRLYTFSDLRWSRYNDQNRLDVSITRFLEPGAEKNQ